MQKFLEHNKAFIHKEGTWCLLFLAEFTNRLPVNLKQKQTRTDIEVPPIPTVTGVPGEICRVMSEGSWLQFGLSCSEVTAMQC